MDFNMERKLGKRRKGWDKRPLVWIECPDTRSVLDTLNIFPSPHSTGCQSTQGNLCVIAILGIKRLSLQDDLMSLAVVQTLHIDVRTSQNNAIQLGENENLFLGWGLKKTWLSLWW